MAEPTDLSGPEPNRDRVEGVPLSDIYAKVSAEGIFTEMSMLSTPPSFVQWFGARLASRLLWIVCAMAAAFLVIWWLTRPSLTDVQSVLGASADPKNVVETLRELQRDHFDQFRNLFQLVVLSGLVPLFTLLAGYAFGTRETVAPTGTPEKEEQE